MPDADNSKDTIKIEVREPAEPKDPIFRDRGSSQGLGTNDFERLLKDNNDWEIRHAPQCEASRKEGDTSQDSEARYQSGNDVGGRVTCQPGASERVCAAANELSTVQAQRTAQELSAELNLAAAACTSIGIIAARFKAYGIVVPAGFCAAGAKLLANEAREYSHYFEHQRDAQTRCQCELGSAFRSSPSESRPRLQREVE